MSVTAAVGVDTLEATMPALLGRSEDLQAAATRLEHAAATLGRCGTDVSRSMELVTARWRGSAEQMARARADEMAAALGDLTKEASEVAAATRRRATSLEAAQRHLEQVREQAKTAAAAGDLTALRRAVTQGHAVAQEDLAASRAFAHRLGASQPTGLPASLAGIIGAKKAVTGVKEAGTSVVAAGMYWRHLATVRKLEAAAAGTDAAKAAGAALAGRPLTPAETKALAAAKAAMAATVKDARWGERNLADKTLMAGLARLEGVGGTVGARAQSALRVADGPLGVVLRRGNAATTAFEGAGDLLHGDSQHPGWRDVTTRVMGGVGAAGGVAMIVGVANPVGAGIALGAVAAYGAWKAGLTVYDNWPTIKAAGTRALGVATKAAQWGVRATVTAASNASSVAVAQTKAVAHSVTTRTQDAANAAVNKAHEAMDATRSAASNVVNSLSGGIRFGAFGVS